jgi:hypothetical protein
VCRLKHVEQLRNIGIVNYATRFYPVGSFYEILTLGSFSRMYSMTQGSKNINFIYYYYYFIFGSMQLSILFYWKDLDYRVLKEGLKRIFRSKERKKEEYGEPFHNAQQLLALYNHAVGHRLNVYRTGGCDKCMQYLNWKLCTEAPASKS